MTDGSSEGGEYGLAEAMAVTERIRAQTRTAAAEARSALPITPLSKIPGGRLDTSTSADAHNGAMPMTREELLAHLDAQSAKGEAALARQNGEINARLGRFEERLEQALGASRRETDELKGAIGNLKTTTIVTAVSAVLAIVLGVAAFNATVLSNMVASFESGKSTASTLAQSAEQLRQAQELAAKTA